MRWFPFLFLLGCPVEPKDIQDQSLGNGQEPGPGKPNLDGPPSGSPKQAGTPPQGQQDVVPLPPPNPNAPQELSGPTAPGTEGNINNGPASGANNPPDQGAAVIGSNGTPKSPVDLNNPASNAVLPMYQQLPTFTDIITEGEEITLSVAVDGATNFDVEFVVQKDGDGRVFPKVIHKQTMVSSPFEITAPANYSDPVWLIVTADRTGDGPSSDDLVAGTTEPLQFQEANISLSFTLTADEDFLTKLPWFSQVENQPVDDGSL